MKIKNPITNVSIQNISGKQYGKLTALSLDVEKIKKSGGIWWTCICDCGELTAITKYRLSSGTTKSCGCLKREATQVRNMKDITGLKYGRLTAISREYIKDNRTYWMCLCSCGNKKTITLNSLTSGRTQSCGCKATESKRRTHTRDITGERFGKLIAVALAYKDKRNHEVWLCRCDCGNTKIVRYASLTKKSSKNTQQSCGCYQREVTAISKLNNMIGCKFTKLTVLKMEYKKFKAKKVRHSVVAICKCDCGNIVECRASEVKGGNVKSCGCLQLEKIYARCEDLTNLKFGKLRAIKRVFGIETTSDVNSGWECKCDCGGTKVVITRHLKNGDVKSCGCMQRRSGIDSSAWKGGITPLYIYIRQNIECWRTDSLKYHKYTCSITGRVGGELVVHHIVSFKEIVHEVMKELSIDINPTMSEYSECEKIAIREKAIELHYKHGFGVVLDKTVHNEFHSYYGKHNTTIQDFEEFKMRYKNKELKKMTAEKVCS